MLPQAILPFTGWNARFDEPPRKFCDVSCRRTAAVRRYPG